MTNYAAFLFFSFFLSLVVNQTSKLSWPYVILCLLEIKQKKTVYSLSCVSAVHFKVKAAVSGGYLWINLLKQISVP
jgi:hypothetical protein